jgi:hypothetical protein
LRFAASFVWADLDVRDGERAFLRAIAAEMGLTDPEDVERLLRHPPRPETVDPVSVPASLAALVREVALRAIAADGEVEDREMELWDLLDVLLPRAS